MKKMAFFMEFIIMDLTEKQQKWILLIPLLIGMILSSINIINFYKHY